jgi:glycosyltransferase involved in cell wall biosynthesis
VSHTRRHHPDIANEKIRVLRVIARLNVGGPARHVLNLGGLDRGPFQTLLVHGAVAGDEASMSDLLENDSIQAVMVPELGRRIAWRDARAFSRLIGICREFRPHIVHTHTAKAGTLGRLAALAWRSASGGRCRIVHTFHGNVFSGYFGRPASAGVRLIERRLASRTDRILVVSPEQRDEIVTRFHIAPAEKVRVVRLGLALDALAETVSTRTPTEWEWPATWPVIGIVGRLAPIKNHELFLRSARRFLDEGGVAGFVIVGGGEREAALRDLTRHLQLDAHVRFLGWRRDLPAVYGAMSIVTLTSRNEGTPVALIEAMAASRPVVATAVGGVEDVVSHEQTGLLIGSGNEAALVAAWRRLIEDRELASRLARRGRESVLARYSTARLLEEMRQIYMELINT